MECCTLRNLIYSSLRVSFLGHSYGKAAESISLCIPTEEQRCVSFMFRVAGLWCYRYPPPPMAWQLMSPTAKLSITGDGQCLFRSSHPRWWILPITHAVWPSTALLLWLFPWPLQCYHLACLQRSKFCRVDRIFENTSVNKIWFWNYD